MCYNNGSGDIGSDMIMGGKGERVQIDLLENEDFQKTFRDKYIHVSHELFMFEKQQEWKYNG